MMPDSKQKNLPGLSAVLIGRDEAHHLNKTIPPLIEIADEVVFVDTGSQDSTVDLATQLGCWVAQVPWQDDFSLAKNHAVDLAKHAWILNVDCDEELTIDQAARDFRAVLDSIDAVPAYRVRIENLNANGEIQPSEAIRLFRNDPVIRFRNPVHESVADSVYEQWRGFRPMLAGFVLRHYGYLGNLNQDKIKRNVMILRRWIEQEPDSVYGNYKLGMNLLFLGSESEAVFFLKQSFEALNAAADRMSYPFAEKLITTLATALMRQGRAQEVEDIKLKVARWTS
ncbi:MAG: glycosyltransferase [Magnetococcales bacterium]|nr:glycosyltransferase [Magnetococcales bacterium]